MELTNFWGKNSYNHPPLTEEMLQTAEKELQVKLPSLYVELLQVQNGGKTKGFVFPTTKKNSWAEDHIPLKSLSGIITNPAIKTAFNILESAYLIGEWDLPEKQVLIEGDGHWWITLDYRNEGEPTVHWIDADMDEDIEIAPSFEEFINGLVLEADFDF